MARPIKETPILTGSDAMHFNRQIKENEAGKNKVSASDYDRAQETYKKVVVR